MELDGLVDGEAETDGDADRDADAEALADTHDVTLRKGRTSEEGWRR
jgi:hypothetical protein